MTTARKQGLLAILVATMWQKVKRLALDFGLKYIRDMISISYPLISPFYFLEW